MLRDLSKVLACDLQLGYSQPWFRFLPPQAFLRQAWLLMSRRSYPETGPRQDDVPAGGQWRANDRQVMKNIVYFDIETQRSADEAGGWDKISLMGMSIGVTYSTGRGDYRIYGEKQVNDLIQELQRADLVVGFNNLRFDYEVLHGYTTLDLRQLPTLDLMIELQNRLQHRLSLDAIAKATFGLEKTAEGMQAIRGSARASCWR